MESAKEGLVLEIKSGEYTSTIKNYEYETCDIFGYNFFIFNIG